MSKACILSHRANLVRLTLVSVLDLEQYHSRHQRQRIPYSGPSNDTDVVSLYTMSYRFIEEPQSFKPRLEHVRLDEQTHRMCLLVQSCWIFAATLAGSAGALSAARVLRRKSLSLTHFVCLQTKSWWSLTGSNR